MFSAVRVAWRDVSPVHCTVLYSGSQPITGQSPTEDNEQWSPRPMRGQDTTIAAGSDCLDPRSQVKVRYSHSAADYQEQNCSRWRQTETSPLSQLLSTGFFFLEFEKFLVRKLYKENFIIIWYLYRYGRALSVLDFISLWFAKMKRSNLNIQIEIFQIFPNHNGLAVDTNSPMGNARYWAQYKP